MLISRRTSPTWRERVDSLETADDQIYYPMFDLNGVARILRSWVRDKRDHIMGYRNATNRSVMTGTMAARHHTEWVYEPGPDEVRDIWEAREAVRRR